MPLGSNNDDPDHGFKCMSVLCNEEGLESGNRSGGGDLTAYLQTFEGQERESNTGQSMST